MIRTHEAGTLRAEHAGERVVLAGWVARRRDHGGVVFIDLRDASGVVQVVWRGEEAIAHELRAEYCVKVTGEVRQRPPGNENPELPTGAIEVVAAAVEVLSEADPLPFPIEGAAEVSEDVRIKYRYLDIRRAEMARALRIRSQAAYLLGDVMRDHRFVNVETPVPDPLHAGRRARLPRPGPAAPGQLVRPAAVPAAVQAAADGRRPRAVLPARPLLPRRGPAQRPAARVHPDRPGDVVRHPRGRDRGRARTSWPRCGATITGYQVPRPIQRMTYADAMARYGSDKPDLRFGVELTDLTKYFAGTEFRVFQAPLRRRGRDARRGVADPARARRLAGLGQVAWRARAWRTR